MEAASIDEGWENAEGRVDFLQISLIKFPRLIESTWNNFNIGFDLFWFSHCNKILVQVEILVK